MRINVGSRNQVKVDAVRAALKLYPGLFPDPEIVGVGVVVAEFGHPKNIDEVCAGAKERAEQAFKNCDYSIGLEGGLIECKACESGYVETSVAVVYNGKRFYYGFGPSFEWPVEVTKLIVSGKADASLAFKQLGLTASDKLGAEKGGINGFLTANRLTREEQIKASLIMAFIYLEKPELR